MSAFPWFQHFGKLSASFAAVGVVRQFDKAHCTAQLINCGQTMVIEFVEIQPAEKAAP
jgi:hypothetical protein